MIPPKAIIFDRDGTLIEHVPYLSDPAQVRLLPGVKEALARVHRAGVLLFLHTNQSGIGRGFFDVAAAEACQARLIELLELGSQPFQRICIAPEAPDQPSRYRKPSPQFAEEIMREYQLAASEICYVGDRGSDLEAAQRAGTCGVGVATGLDDLAAELHELGLAENFPIFGSLALAIGYLFPDA
jgi:D-glycero-D-manno-heptose 1,7-bisphosphate phosphatase